jgi:6-hydroxytryprostatin B O-methyltransferase
MSPSLLELAQQVQASSQIIVDHLQRNALPSPSLAADAYPFFPGTGPPGVDTFPRLSEDIRTARTQLRVAAANLVQLAAGPAEAAFTCLTGHWMSACLQFIYHYRLAEHVPVSADISYTDLAVKAGVVPNQCTRVLKFVATHGFFHQTRPGHVAHSAMSKMLLVPDFRDTVGYVTEESFMGAPKLVEATEKFPGSGEKNETCWNLGHGTDLPMFEYFERHPARMQRFMGCMRSLASGESFSIKNVVDAFDWQGLGKGLVVDVGGSFGHCCSEIAAAAPDLDFIVQDLEKVVAQAQSERANDKDIDRIKFQAHNFFTEQPVKNASVYLLRFICHDYSDKYAAQILGHLAAAMGPTSRILIVDEVMPEVGVLSKVEEQRAR